MRRIRPARIARNSPADTLVGVLEPQCRKIPIAVSIPISERMESQSSWMIVGFGLKPERMIVQRQLSAAKSELSAVKSELSIVRAEGLAIESGGEKRRVGGVCFVGVRLSSTREWEGIGRLRTYAWRCNARNAGDCKCTFRNANSANANRAELTIVALFRFAGVNASFILKSGEENRIRSCKLYAINNFSR